MAGCGGFDAGQWWVDELGRTHPAGGLHASFDSVLLTHLGQIKVVAAEDALEITWDAREVSAEGFSYIVERLLNCRAETAVTLRFLYYGWVEEIFPTPFAAVERMQEIRDCCHIEILYPTLMQEHEINENTFSSPLIRSGFELWENSGGDFMNKEPDQTAGYLNHVIMFREHAKSGDLLYSWVGNRSTCTQVYGRKWAAKIMGTPSSKSSGPETDSYAMSMDRIINSVMETGRPRYHHVRALMTTGGKPAWQSYERLLTRHTLKGGQPVVVLLSDHSQNLSIPLAGRP